jgi:hypothetical protein
MKKVQSAIVRVINRPTRLPSERRGSSAGDRRSIVQIAQNVFRTAESNYDSTSPGASPLPPSVQHFDQLGASENHNLRLTSPFSSISSSPSLASPSCVSANSSTSTVPGLSEFSFSPLFGSSAGFLFENVLKTPERKKTKPQRTPQTKSSSPSARVGSLTKLPSRYICTHKNLQLSIQADSSIGNSIKDFLVVEHEQEPDSSGILLKTPLQGNLDSQQACLANSHHLIELFVRPNGFIYLQPPENYVLKTAGAIRMDYKDGKLTFSNLMMVRSALLFSVIAEEKTTQKLVDDIQENKIRHDISITFDTLAGKVGQPLFDPSGNRRGGDGKVGQSLFDPSENRRGGDGKVGQSLSEPSGNRREVPSMTGFGKVGQSGGFPFDDRRQRPSMTAFGKVGQSGGFPFDDRRGGAAPMGYGKVGQSGGFPFDDRRQRPSMTAFGKVGQSGGFPFDDRRGGAAPMGYGKVGQSLNREVYTPKFDLGLQESVSSCAIEGIDSTTIGNAYKFGNVLMLSFDDTNIVPGNHIVNGLNLAFKETLFLDKGVTKNGYYLDLNELPKNGDIEFQSYLVLGADEKSSYLLNGLRYTETVDRVLKKQTITNQNQRSISTPPIIVSKFNLNQPHKRKRSNSEGVIQGGVVGVVRRLREDKKIRKM